jgi:hypothetical protein
MLSQLSREIHQGPPSLLVPSPSLESHQRSQTPLPKFEGGRPPSPTTTAARRRPEVSKVELSCRCDVIGANLIEIRTSKHHSCLSLVSSSRPAQRCRHSALFHRYPFQDLISTIHQAVDDPDKEHHAHSPKLNLDCRSVD